MGRRPDYAGINLEDQDFRFKNFSSSISTDVRSINRRACVGEIFLTQAPGDGTAYIERRPAIEWQTSRGRRSIESIFADGREEQLKKGMRMNRNLAKFRGQLTRRIVAVISQQAID
jgi:hypothetical protein